jgi:hypothetical protein
VPKVEVQPLPARNPVRLQVLPKTAAEEVVFAPVIIRQKKTRRVPGQIAINRGSCSF